MKAFFLLRRAIALCASVAALCLLLCPGPVAATPQGPTKAASAASASPLRLTIDDTAVRRLIALIEAKDTSDASLEKWMDLPANQNLLRVGRIQGDITRGELKEKAIAVIKGEATERTQQRGTFGRLLLEPLSDYKGMLDALKATQEERIRQINARLAAFSPEKINASATVYLHVGGDWDAINHRGDIFLNIHFWHDYHKPGWDGLNMIIAHEAMHTVQNAAYGNPEEQDDGEGAWLSALSKIQREGIARYVEYDTDPQPYEPHTYGFFYRAIAAEGLRAFPRTLTLLQPLHDACFPQFDKNRFASNFSRGISNGGPYYVIGHGIAKAIDEKQGRAALVGTVKNGPKDFFTRYIALSTRDPALPRLPPDVEKRVLEMKARL